MAEPAADIVAGLTRWLAANRVDAAAAGRAREHWMRQQLAEEATVAGVLLDLAERGLTVVVRGIDGRRRRVAVRAVAEDFCAVRGTDGTDTLLRYRGIATIETGAATGPDSGFDTPSSGSRPPALDLTLAEALASLAPERARVVVVSAGATIVTGELRSVGRDVLVLRPDGEPRTTYLPLDPVVQVTVVA